MKVICRRDSFALNIKVRQQRIRIWIKVIAFYLMQTFVDSSSIESRKTKPSVRLAKVLYFGLWPSVSFSLSSFFFWLTSSDNKEKKLKRILVKKKKTILECDKNYWPMRGCKRKGEEKRIEMRYLWTRWKKRKPEAIPWSSWCDLGDVTFFLVKSSTLAIT